jgi:predicted chitinase
MGQNIKGFNQWKKLNEESWADYLSNLASAAFTGSPMPASSPTGSAPIATAVAGAATTAATALGIKDKSNKKGSADKTKDSAKNTATKFKKFDPAIPTENFAAIEAAMDRHGITNDFARKAILGVISKEGAKLSPEISYSSTSNDRIRTIFKDRVSGLSDSELTALKNNQTKFWDRVYGPDDPTGRGAKYGNTEPGDGAKYRGRGFNGITFKSNYIKLQQLFNEIGKLKTEGSVDIVEDPTLLENPDIAAEFAVLYFINSFKGRGKDLNAYNSLESAVEDYVQANAGWGSNIHSGHNAQGLSKALSYASTIA